MLYAVVRVAVKIGTALPRSWLPIVGSWLGRFAYTVLGDARRTSLANLALVHPGIDLPHRQALAREVFAALGRNLTDTVALLDPREPPGRTLSVSASSAAVLSAALCRNRGVVYVTGHLGPWERMAALLADLGFPITTMARESYDPRFHRLLYDRLRKHRNVETIYRGTSTAPLAIVRALRRGRVLGFLVDLPGRTPTIPATLLGQPSRLPLGPARLALRLRTSVVIGTPAPGPSGLEVHITELPTTDLAPDDAGERELTRRMADALSDRIRALPSHWPWMHPFVEPMSSG